MPSPRLRDCRGWVHVGSSCQLGAIAPVEPALGCFDIWLADVIWSQGLCCDGARRATNRRSPHRLLSFVLHYSRVLANAPAYALYVYATADGDAIGSVVGDVRQS